MVAFVIDQYYLVITLLITIGWQCLGFFIAWTLQFDKITDFTGGSNFFVLALVTLLMGNTFYARNIVASVFQMVWAARLAGFLLFRVLKTGSDNRFDDIRSHFFKFAGFWVGQILWVWVVSLPVVILNSPAVSDYSRGGDNPSFGTGRDIAGIILWALGFIVESWADIAKFWYKSNNPPKNRPCTAQVWGWSRHPPYFGEIILQWGIWILTISPSTNGRVDGGAKSAQYGAVVGPIFTTLLLLFASGIPTAEKPTGKKFYLQSYSPNPDRENDGGSTWRHYKGYLDRTSLLIPIPPALYKPLPRWVKTWVLLDLPMYQFDEKKDGEKAIEEERQKLERERS